VLYILTETNGWLDVRYFGGSLELVSLDGWGVFISLYSVTRCTRRMLMNVVTGTDAHLRLPKLVSPCGCNEIV
jgi:hypothetical protein